MSANTLRNPSVAIIGAGMTGILAAIKLREAGIDDIVVLEKADELGAPGARIPIRGWPVTFRRICIPTASGVILNGAIALPGG
ncbi:FAD-dependent oxidoreductase [Halioglobus japonicus]|uniref:FAD-dependent oxidoreductase n=1 Tax=Halioglobus japonicus TaxID=930805 RepID=UPI00197A9F75|nr:FAD-dependent oxidoreductase [Halioglobus japonicus]